MLLSLDELDKIAIHATDKDRLKFILPLNKAMEKYHINTKGRIAAFLAQVIHESGSLHYVEEISTGRQYNGRRDLGNTEPEAIEIATQNYSTPGEWWKGHGLIQITGFYNHKIVGGVLGLDLLLKPKLLCFPEHACNSAGWFFSSRGCNEMADVGLFGQITKTINGGYNGQKERLASYNLAKKVFKL